MLNAVAKKPSHSKFNIHNSKFFLCTTNLPGVKKYSNLIFGLRPIIEAIEAGKTIDKLIVQKGLSGDLYNELRQHVKAHRIPIQSVPVERLNRFTKKNHQGVVGFLSPVEFHSLGDVVTRVFEEGQTPLIVVLDRITDVRNFGAIVRTAECAGAHAVVVPQRGGAAINPDAAKTSAGALFRVPICRENNIHQAISFLQNSGLQVVGCTEKTENSLYKVDYTVPTAILMGSEEDGISDEAMEAADALAQIPMHGEIGSLNVSVATGIILYEAVRQRATA